MSNFTAVIIVSIFIILLLIITILLLIYYRKLSSKQNFTTSLTKKAIEEGKPIDVNIRSIHTGFKSLPLKIPFGFSSNTGLCKLILYKDYLVYKIFKTKNKLYTNIELVSYYDYKITRGVVLVFKDSPIIIRITTWDIVDAKKLIKFFEIKGCPISKEAQKLLKVKNKKS